MTLIEIIVSMIILSLLAAGLYSIFSFVGAKKQGGPGSPRDNQAISYARQTLEDLRNSVSANTTQAAMLNDTTANCVGKTAHSVCGTGKEYTYPLPAGDFKDKYGGVRKYTVWDIADGNGDVAYKKVTATVTWND